MQLKVVKVLLDYMDKIFSISEIIEASNNILNEPSNNLTITKNNHLEPLLLVNEISEDLNIDEKIKNEIIKELYLFFKKKIKKNTLKIIFDQRIEIKKFQREINHLNENKKILETNSHKLQSQLDKIIVDKKMLKINNQKVETKLEETKQTNRSLEINNHELKNTVGRYISNTKKLQNEINQLKNNQSESSINNQKIEEINQKIKFFQEDNLRLSNELFISKERYNIVKKQLNDFELQKKQLSNQIQQLNNSINESNLITPSFIDKLPTEATEVLKNTNDKDVANLNEKINKLFKKL